MLQTTGENGYQRLMLYLLLRISIFLVRVLNLAKTTALGAALSGGRRSIQVVSTYLPLRCTAQ